MIEMPEAANLARQLAEVAAGKRIVEVEVGQTPMKWAWYSGTPDEYAQWLVGNSIQGGRGIGGHVVADLAGGRVLSFGDGVRLRWVGPGEKPPAKHQLHLGFEGGASLYGSVQMYGWLSVYGGEAEPDVYLGRASEAPSPLTDQFTRVYFQGIVDAVAGTPTCAKALLATEQRVPGLGNGVLQDILYQARVHPRRRVVEMSTEELDALYRSVVCTLRQMTEEGGRDTELDLFGQPGGYRTLMSRLTVGRPCARCGEPIMKEAFMGGAVYTCPGCQRRQGA